MEILPDRTMTAQERMTIDELRNYLRRIKNRFVQRLTCHVPGQATGTLEVLVASGPPSFPNYLWESCRSPYGDLIGDHCLG